METRTVASASTRWSTGRDAELAALPVAAAGTYAYHALARHDGNTVTVADVLRRPGAVQLSVDHARLLAALGSDQAAIKAAFGEVRQSCMACHGANGNSQVGAFPTLAGQSDRYIYLQLRDYKEGRRKNPMMSAVASKAARTCFATAIWPG